MFFIISEPDSLLAIFIFHVIASEQRERGNPAVWLFKVYKLKLFLFARSAVKT